MLNNYCNPLVSIRCMTFNHKPYIRQCLDGFVMQKTDFPFVALIMDANDYIRVIAPHKTNKQCTFAILFLKYNHYSIKKNKKSYIDEWDDSTRYIAICEGDDFWTYPYKLQEQFNIMESQTNCTICFNRVQAVKSDDLTPKFLIPKEEATFSEGIIHLENLVKEEFELNRWCFHTSSFFIRTFYYNTFEKFQKEHFPSFPYGDMPLQLYTLSKGDGYFLGKTMGCYRFLSGGYNSSLLADKEKRVKMTKLVIKGFKEFDKFTGFKYHNIIDRKNRREEFRKIYDKKSYKLRHWEFMKPIMYHKLYVKINKYSPRLYRIIKNTRDFFTT